MFRSRWIGLGLLGIGVALLSLSIFYYTYSFFATRNLDRLNVQVDTPSEPGDTLTLSELQPLPRDPGPSEQSATPPSTRSPENSETPPALAGPVPGEQALYPGAFIPARQWADPRGTMALGQRELLEGFVPVQANLGIAVRASNLRIPSVKIDATVNELAIADLQDSHRYETPKFTVGHIPTTSNPGAQGNGWYFGHLESPIQNEGNIFSRLPAIPGLLEEGEDVYVIVTAEGRDYLYQVSETQVVHQDDLVLYHADDARVTLVTCLPRFVYDHRLLVTAKLVGVADGPTS